MVELISVHVPKCAGSSLGSALARVYGPDAIFVDLATAPGHPTSPANLDPDGYFEGFRERGYGFLEGKRVVHGHFHIRKYDLLPERCLRVTFLRHPVARTISHYRYWRQRTRRGHPLHHYMLDNDLDVVRFARLPIIRYFYSRTFFGGVERSRFDFVGRVDALDVDLPKFGELIGHSLSVRSENVTPGGSERIEDTETLDKLAGILADDIKFYRRWCGA